MEHTVAKNYPRLDIYTFGAHLLDSGDLDPVYIMLHKAELSTEQLSRWLVAYWCLYHCGAASWLSNCEGRTFWSKLLDAAANTDPAPTGGRWPRGHERRHFRGGAAVTAVRSYMEQFPEPEDMVDYIIGVDRPGPGSDARLDFISTSSRVQDLALFGPWIGFKVCDMIDRVLEYPVDFNQAAVFMFDDPRKAAFMLWRQLMGLPESAKPKDRAAEAAVIHGVVQHLAEHFKGFQAPPLYDRPIGVQEIETILCKWKSSLNGHYPLFNDIDEINAGLVGWGSTADLLRSCMPKRPK